MTCSADTFGDMAAPHQPESLSKETGLACTDDSIRTAQTTRFFQIVRPKFEHFEYSDDVIMEMLNGLPDETVSIIDRMLNEYPVGKVPVHLFSLVTRRADVQHYRDLETYMPLLDYRHFESVYALQHYRSLDWFPPSYEDDRDRILGFLTTMAFLIHSIAYAPHQDRASMLRGNYLISHPLGFLDDNEEYLLPLDERLPKLVYDNPQHRVRLISFARDRGSISYDLLKSSLDTHTSLGSGAL